MIIILFVLTVFCSPFWVITRSYYGSRFALLMFLGWATHLLIFPTTLQAFELVVSLLYSFEVVDLRGDLLPVVRAYYGSLVTAYHEALRIPPVFWVDYPLAVVYVLGLCFLPYHMLTTFIMSAQERPTGTMGRRTLSAKENITGDVRNMIAWSLLSLVGLVLERIEIWIFAVHVAIMVLPYVVLGTAGGVHGRFRELEKFKLSSLWFGRVRREEDAISPLELGAKVRIAKELQPKGRRYDRYTILGNRASELEDFASDDP